MAIMVSKYDHCLIDLLWRWDAGELDAEIPLVISNHPDLAPRAAPGSRPARGDVQHPLLPPAGDEGDEG
jgi:formyltetrahydrofolate hydrolase